MNQYKTKYKLWFRTIALVLVCTFTIDTLVWAAPPEKTETGTVPKGTIPVSATNLTLLPYLGEVKDNFLGTSGKLIIHIQDAHCNYSCQKSIAETINYLNSTYNINLVALEGGAGNYDLTPFAGMQDKTLREKVSDYLVKEGRINGAEFFAINNPEKITLKGLEKAGLYKENLEAYQDSLKYKDEVDNILNKLEKDLSNQKEYIYTPELKEFEQKKLDYENKKLGLNEYVSYLALSLRPRAKRGGSNLNYPNLDKLFNVIENEKAIDFKRADIERQILIDELTKRLSSMELETLVENSVKFKEGRITQHEFYAYLIRKASTIDIDAAKTFPNLAAYENYVKIYESLNSEALFDEIEAFEGKIVNNLCKTDEEKKLYELSESLALLKKFFNLSITPTEYEKVGTALTFLLNSTSQKISAVPTFSSAYVQMGKFYELAHKRDEAFLKNIANYTKKNSALIIVTGGFHAENLKNLIKEKGYSYIAITPKFKGDGENNPYFKLLGGNFIKKEEALKIALSAISTIAIPSMFSEISADMGVPNRTERVGKTDVDKNSIYRIPAIGPEQFEREYAKIIGEIDKADLKDLPKYVERLEKEFAWINRIIASCLRKLDEASPVYKALKTYQETLANIHRDIIAACNRAIQDLEQVEQGLKKIREEIEKLEEQQRVLKQNGPTDELEKVEAQLDKLYRQATSEVEESEKVIAGKEEDIKKALKRQIAIIGSSLNNSFERHLWSEVFLTSDAAEQENILLGIIEGQFSDASESAVLKRAASQQIVQGMRTAKERYEPSIEVPQSFARGKIVEALRQNEKAQRIFEDRARKDLERLYAKTRLARIWKIFKLRTSRIWQIVKKHRRLVLSSLLLISVVGAPFIIQLVDHEVVAPTGLPTTPDLATQKYQALQIGILENFTASINAINKEETSGEIRAPYEARKQEILEHISELENKLRKLEEDKEAFEQSMATPQDLASQFAALDTSSRRLESSTFSGNPLGRETAPLPNQWNTFSSTEDDSEPSEEDPDEDFIPEQVGPDFVVPQNLLETIGPEQVTHGGGDATSGGEWVADVEGGNGYLANTSYSKINPLTGEYSPVESDWQVWQLNPREEATGWITKPTHLRMRMILPIPPNKKIVSIQTERQGVTGGIFYDSRNRIWYVKFNSYPGKAIRIGVKDAAWHDSFNIPSISLSETTPDTWQEYFPESVRRTLESAQNLSIEERIKVKKEILHQFYYTTNPLMAELNAGNTNFLQTAFTYYALKCDGFSMLDAILSHLLNIPVMIQGGFMDKEGNGTFTTDESHAWVLTQDGIEEATAFAGEVSPLYGKRATREDWERELEYIKNRRGHATRQLDRVSEMTTLTQAKENLEREISSREGEIDRIQNEMENAGETVNKEAYYESLLKKCEENLAALNIPQLAQLAREALPQIKALIEKSKTMVAIDEENQDEYKLMATGHFVLKMLVQLEEALAHLKPLLSPDKYASLVIEIHSAKKEIYLKIQEYKKSFFIQTELNEPLPRDFSLPSPSYNGPEEENNLVESLIILPGQEDEGSVVVDLITGEEYEIPYNAEVVDYSQGLLVIKMPSRQDPLVSIYKIIGEMAGEYADTEFAGFKLYTALNGEWLGVVKPLTGAEGENYLPSQIFIGPSAKKAELNQLTKKIRPPFKYVQRANSLEVTSDDDCIMLPNGDWIANVIYHDGSEGYVGTLALESGLQGKTLGIRLFPPIVSPNGEWLGVVKYPIVGGPLVVGNTSLAEKINKEIHETVGSRDLYDLEVLLDGELRGKWLGLANDENGVRRLVGPLAELWGLKEINYTGSEEPGEIEKIYPQGLIKILCADGLRRYLGPLANQVDLTWRNIASGEVPKFYAEVREPSFFSNGSWVEIVRYVNAPPDRNLGLMGSNLPPDIARRRFYDLKDKHGHMKIDIGSGRGDDWHVWGREDEHNWEWIGPHGIGRDSAGEISPLGGIDERELEFVSLGSPEHKKRVREDRLDYELRLQALYGIGDPNEADRCMALLPNRFDAMWRYFDVLAEAKEDADSQEKALMIIKKILKELEKFQVHDQDHPAPRFYNHEEALRIIEKHLDWFLEAANRGNVSEEFSLLFKFLQKTSSGHLIMEFIRKLPEAKEGGLKTPEYIRKSWCVEQGLDRCKFTPNEVDKIVLDYVRWLKDKHNIPEHCDPYLFPFLFKGDDQKIKAINELLLNELDDRYYEYAKQLNDAFNALTDSGTKLLDFFIGTKGRELNQETLNNIVALLREQSGIQDKLFDIEVSSSVRNHPAYRLAKLIRKNWEGFKLAYDVAPWDSARLEEQENLRKWNHINSRLTEILGEDFSSGKGDFSPWRVLLIELVYDAFGVAFLIGLAYLGLSYISDSLRRKDRIIGLSGDEVIMRILEGIHYNKRAISDAALCVALEPPSKEKSFFMRLIGLIPFAVVFVTRDTHEHRLRQRMNHEILELVQSLSSPHHVIPGESEGRDPESMKNIDPRFRGDDKNMVKIYHRLHSILSKYGKKVCIEDPKRKESLHASLTPEELSARIRNAMNDIRLLDISPVEAHSLRSNGTALKRQGAGSEFRDRREYVPGDDIRKVDHRVFARTDRWLTNTTETDAIREAGILIDMRSAFDSGNLDTWINDTAKSLIVMLDRRRIRDKEHYTLKRLVFIMPDGTIDEIQKINMKKGGMSELLIALQQKYIKARGMMEEVTKEEETVYHLRFYSAEENARYAERIRATDLFASKERTTRRVNESLARLNLSGEYVFCVGIPLDNREAISRSLIKNRTVLLFWKGNRAIPTVIARPVKAITPNDAIGKFKELEPIGVDETGRLKGKIQLIEADGSLGAITDISQIPHRDGKLKELMSGLRRLLKLIDSPKVTDSQRLVLKNYIFTRFLRHFPKNLIITSDVGGGFLGVGKPNLLVLNQDLIQDPIYLLHEIIEYIKHNDSKTMQDLYNGLGQNKPGHKWFKSHEQKYEAQGNLAYFRDNEVHYMIRAFTREVFPKEDLALTSKIKQFINAWTRDQKIARIESQRTGYTGAESPYQATYPTRLINVLKNRSAQSEKPAIIVDLGSGEGQIAEWMNDQGFSVIGIDINEDSIQRAKDKALTQSRRLIEELSANSALKALRESPQTAVSYQYGDLAQGISLPDASVDAVVLHRTLGQVLDLEARHRIIKEIYRILRPGGVISYLDIRVIKPEDKVGLDFERIYKIQSYIIGKLLEDGTLPQALKYYVDRPETQLHIAWQAIGDELRTELDYGSADEMLEDVRTGKIRILFTAIYERPESVRTRFEGQGFKIMDYQEARIPRKKAPEHSTPLSGFIAQKPSVIEPGHITDSIKDMLKILNSAPLMNQPCTIGMVVKANPGDNIDMLLEERFAQEIEILGRRIGKKLQTDRGILEYQVDNIKYVAYIDDGTESKENLERIARFKDRLQAQGNPKQRTFTWILSNDARREAKSYIESLNEVSHLVGLKGEYLPVSWQMLVGPLFANLIDSKARANTNESERIEALVKAIIESISKMTRLDFNELNKTLGNQLRDIDSVQLSQLFNGISLVLNLPDIVPVTHTLSEYRKADFAVLASL